MKIIWMLDDINTMNGMVQVVIGLSNHFIEKGHEVRINSFFSEDGSTCRRKIPPAEKEFVRF